jgi:hypothetical protein
MEELIHGSEPSISRKRNLFPVILVSLRQTGASGYVGRWYTASFWGGVACILFYTAFGLIFVRMHARQIAAEMGLLARFGMTPLISPDDVHLKLFKHQLGSALFFGLTLGVLNAFICMVLTLPAWISGRSTRNDLFVFTAAVLMCTYFCFSHELPLASICFGLLGPIVFTLPWLLIVRKTGRPIASLKAWAVFFGIIVVPLLILIVTGTSFLSIRDSMLSMPISRTLSDFYYEHTLLAADVIKPVSARSQNVIAISDDSRSVGYMPHGTLWIQLKAPCSVAGATFVASRGVLNCRAVRLPDDGLSANHENRIIEKYAKAIDPNKDMRGAIGLFLFSGPLIAIIVLLLSWLAFGLEHIYIRSRIAALVVVIAYLSIFAPLFHGAYLTAQLKAHPEKIFNYASSPSERMRYIALSVYPGALAPESLVRLMNDPSARVRLNAAIEAGERRDPSLLPDIETRLKDGEMNVRTKACLALGRMGSDRAISLLDKTIKADPSWYVRDYAYAALGRIRPEARLVRISQ